MLRFYASIRHICGGRITIVGSELTITTAAIGESSDAAPRAGIAAKFKFGVHPHMLWHACGYALANRSRHNLGHKNIQHTVATPSWRRPASRISGAKTETLNT